MRWPFHALFARGTGYFSFQAPPVPPTKPGTAFDPMQSANRGCPVGASVPALGHEALLPRALLAARESAVRRLSPASAPAANIAVCFSMEPAAEGNAAARDAIVG